MDAVDIIRVPQVLTREQRAAQENELQEEFENPPISEDREERLQNPILYVQDREWSYSQAAEKAGVSKSAVCRYACVVTLFFFVFFPLSLLLTIFFYFVELFRH